MNGNINEENPNNIAHEVAQFFKHLIHPYGDIWLEKVTPEIQQIQEMVGDEPQITAIEENIQAAEEINDRMKATPFTRKNLVLWSLTGIIFYNYFINPEFISFLENNKEFYDLISLIVKIFFGYTLKSTFDLNPDDKDALRKIQGNVEEAIRELKKEIQPYDDEYDDDEYDDVRRTRRRWKNANYK